MDTVGTRQPRPWQAHTPNVLTGMRLVFACAFFAVLSFWRYADSPVLLGARYDPWLLAATGLFIIAAITDALDGYLARRWNAVSVFGRIMDPFADKLLVIGAFAFMASPAFWVPATGTRPGVQVSGVTAWMVAVVLGRELLVTSIRGAMEGAGVSFAASWSGKLKMILQSMIIPSVLLILSVRAVTPGSPGSVAGKIQLTKGISIAMWITVLVTAWSGIPYVLRAVTTARSTKPGGAR